MPHDRVIREAGHVEYARVGTDACDAFGQLPAAHARHYDVSNNQIDPAGEPFADLLRGEKWLEDLLLRLAVHAAAVVRYRKHNIVAGLHHFLSIDMGAIQISVARADRNVPTHGQGVAGVHDEVHEDLFNLSRVGLDLSQAWIKFRL